MLAGDQILELGRSRGLWYEAQLLEFLHIGLIAEKRSAFLAQLVCHRIWQAGRSDNAQPGFGRRIGKAGFRDARHGAQAAKALMPGGDDCRQRLAVDLRCEQRWSVDQQLDVPAQRGGEGVRAGLEGNDRGAEPGLS